MCTVTCTVDTVVKYVLSFVYFVLSGPTHTKAAHTSKSPPSLRALVITTPPCTTWTGLSSHTLSQGHMATPKVTHSATLSYRLSPHAQIESYT